MSNNNEGVIDKARPRIAAVIPAYKSRDQILSVLGKIGPEVDQIFIIDDACPFRTGEFVKHNFNDKRITILVHDKNEGVGGAVITGYKSAIAAGSQIVIKIDSDGQMDPLEIPRLLQPILDGHADYTKGNRFFDVEKIRLMPLHRLIGNAGLSFFSKISSGYWSIFDPNNGYTAINTKSLAYLPLDKIEKRYFFESDMLFRLNLARAVVKDIPMDAFYGNEVSNLSAMKSVFEFSFKHSKNFLKRIVYNYFLREFSLATLNFAIGSLLFGFGISFGFKSWLTSLSTGSPTATGALILIAMSVLSGLQMLLSFISYDIAHEPDATLSRIN
jgi:hypothetical protein